MSNEEWMNLAKCKDRLDYFFTEHLPIAQARKLQMIAKSICMQCEVKQECIEYAIKNDEQYGIWGGMTVKELRSYNRNIFRLADNDRRI
jgi:hypothetical protein